MEQPNLSYFVELARGDKKLISELIEVLKTEFPEESKSYYKSLHSDDYNNISEHVHRVKHKFSILGLTEAYILANDYENDLRNAVTDKKEEFEKILTIISAYLKTI